MAEGVQLASSLPTTMGAAREFSGNYDKFSSVVTTAENKYESLNEAYKKLKSSIQDVSHPAVLMDDQNLAQLLEQYKDLAEAGALKAALEQYSDLAETHARAQGAYNALAMTQVALEAKQTQEHQQLSVARSKLAGYKMKQNDATSFQTATNRLRLASIDLTSRAVYDYAKAVDFATVSGKRDVSAGDDSSAAFIWSDFYGSLSETEAGFRKRILDIDRRHDLFLAERNSSRKGTSVSYSLELTTIRRELAKTGQASFRITPDNTEFVGLYLPTIEAVTVTLRFAAGPTFAINTYLVHLGDSAFVRRNGRVERFIHMQRADQIRTNRVKAVLEQKLFNDDYTWYAQLSPFAHWLIRDFPGQGSTVPWQRLKEASLNFTLSHDTSLPPVVS